MPRRLKITKKCESAIKSTLKDLGKTMRAYDKPVIQIEKTWTKIFDSTGRLNVCPCDFQEFHMDMISAYGNLASGKPSMMVANLAKAKTSLKEGLEKCKVELG